MDAILVKQAFTLKLGRVCYLKIILLLFKHSLVYAALFMLLRQANLMYIMLKSMQNHAVYS